MTSSSMRFHSKQYMLPPASIQDLASISTNYLDRLTPTCIRDLAFMQDPAFIQMFYGNQ